MLDLSKVWASSGVCDEKKMRRGRVRITGSRVVKMTESITFKLGKEEKEDSFSPFMSLTLASIF